MNLSFVHLFPGKWKILYNILFFPLAWFAWTIEGEGYEFVLKVLFLAPPAFFLVIAVFCTAIALVTIIFRPNRNYFSATLLITWWDGGKSILLYWAGIFKFAFYLFGWGYGALRIIILGFFQTIKDILFLPMSIIVRAFKGYSMPGIPWLAVFMTCGWIILESAVFAFIISDKASGVITAMASVELHTSIVIAGAFVFLTMFIGGSFACMHGLVVAFEEKKPFGMIKMLVVELAVMLFEVLFFYQEFVMTLRPFLNEMTGGTFIMGMGHILTISVMGWFAVRAGIWFLFAKYGTPTLIMIISREGMIKTDGNMKPKVIGGPLMWIKEIFEELQTEIDWFSNKGKEITEAFVLPPVQLLASMTNFLMLLLTGSHMFNLPIKKLSDIKDTKNLVEQLRKVEKNEK